MPKINPYLTFNGDCEEAFELYKSVFGGEFSILQRFSEMPSSEGELTPEDADKIMHVSLPIGRDTLMGSDASSMSGEVALGANFSVNVAPESREAAERIFNALADGGVVKMPLVEQFWGAMFGMCEDRFGINWMVNFHEESA